MMGRLMKWLDEHGDEPAIFWEEHYDDDEKKWKTDSFIIDPVGFMKTKKMLGLDHRKDYIDTEARTIEDVDDEIKSLLYKRRRLLRNGSGIQGRIEAKER